MGPSREPSPSARRMDQCSRRGSRRSDVRHPRGHLHLAQHLPQQIWLPSDPGLRVRLRRPLPLTAPCRQASWLLAGGGRTSWWIDEEPTSRHTCSYAAREPVPHRVRRPLAVGHRDKRRSQKGRRTMRPCDLNRAQPAPREANVHRHAGRSHPPDSTACRRTSVTGHACPDPPGSQPGPEVSDYLGEFVDPNWRTDALCLPRRQGDYAVKADQQNQVVAVFSRWPERALCELIDGP